jgi:hypothetical protein
VWLEDIYFARTVTPYSDSISLDTVAPSGGTMRIIGEGAIAANVSWSGIRDSGAGITEYKLFGGTSAPTGCTASSPLYTGTATAFTHAGLSGATTYYYLLCATDGAGNTSSGIRGSIFTRAEYIPPTGTVTINSGAAFTGSPTVSVSISASDDSGVASMCLGTGSTCTSFVPFSATVPFTVSGSSGGKTVKVWLRDALGNTTASPLVDSITLDVTAPSRGSVALTPAAGQLTVSWSGFIDNSGGSGISSYRIAYARGATPATGCTSGTLIDPATSGQVLTGLSVGSYTVRVCAVDAVGNRGAGVTRSASVR